MVLHVIDWVVLLAYTALMVWIGFRYTQKAQSSVEEFYASGRNLTWWLAGTSMVATTFSADTPLVIGAWVRDHGIWKNWLWWCYAVSGLLTAFLFARYWRRLGVLTSVELAEHRYGGREASLLRGMFAFFQAGISNVCVLSWVLIAAYKILGVMFGVDRLPAITIACIVTLVYSLASGFWGVVVTDFWQFLIAIIGAIALAVFAWQGIGGGEGLSAAIARGDITATQLSFLPPAGPGSFFDASFWTPAIAVTAVYFGVSWWAAESVDGGSYIIQRIVACKDERHGVLAQLWFNVAHHAIRPWPWIVVALASLIVFKPIEVTSPVDGTIVSVSQEHVEIRDSANQLVAVPIARPGEVWTPLPLNSLDENEAVKAGQVIGRTDSERAYPAMIVRYMPPGWLGLVLAALLAALMSTIDTHVILASSYVVNDLYRRFVAPDRTDRHYVFVGRVAGVVVMILASIVAWRSDSIGDLFQHLLALLAGIGPAYVMRWTWWRVTARTEIAALLTSAISSALYKHFEDRIPLPLWLDGDGILTAEGRLMLVAFTSMLVATLVTLLSKRPDPRSLVKFYEAVRPIGAWGPVKELTTARPQRGEFGIAILGTVTSFATIFGLLFGVGNILLGSLGDGIPGLLIAAVAGAVAWYCVNRLSSRHAVAA